MTYLGPALRRVTAFAAAVGLAVLGILAVPAGPAAATPAGPTHQVPGQFIAKLYTEALGRLPTQREWTAAADGFRAAGCNAQSLAALGQQVYTSVDYAGLGYDNVSRLVTLYRGAWNGEPDTAGLAGWRDGLDHGESWSIVVARFFVADRFTGLVPQICSAAADSSATSYALSGGAAGVVPTGTAGFSGTEAQLQAILDDTPRGGIVQLAQRALITLTRPLTIPPGVVLTTTGRPDPAHYAEMGRLVRAGSFDAALVRVSSAARLTGVWVDGARDSPAEIGPDRYDITVLGGRRTAVTGNKVSNTAGPASITVLGRGDGHPCSSVAVSRNVITAYSDDHYLTRQLPDGHSLGTWSDGLRVGCADTTVRANQIVDTGGTGIAVYPGSAQPHRNVPQRSRVVANTVLSAGVPMYAGIVADPLFYVLGQGEPRSYPYRGALIEHNTVWTAATTHIVIGIGAGSRAWYAGTAMLGPNSGTGLRISDNRTGPVGARVRTGIAISGMSGVRLEPGPARWLHAGVPGKPGNPCPAVDVAASRSAGTAAGLKTDVPWTDTDFDGCMGDA